MSLAVRHLAALAAARLLEEDTAGIDSTDILHLARAGIVAVMRGRGGPTPLERLNLAKVVLSRDFLPLLTEEQLFFEIERRNAIHDARDTAGPGPLS